MDIPSWAYLLIGLSLIFVTAYFSLVETAFSCFNRFKMEVKANDGSRSADLVLKVNKHFNWALVTILVAINAISIVLSVISTTIFFRMIFHNDEGGEGIMNTLVSVLSSLVLTIIVYFLGEVIPKQIARKIPEKVVVWAVYPLIFFMVLFSWVILLFRGIPWLVGKIFKMKEAPELTEEDFISEIERNESFSLLEENESDIIQNSLDFSDTLVKEVFTPKEKMRAIDISKESTASLVKKISKGTYSRIPVYNKNINNIVGILVVKKFLSAYLKNKSIKIADYLDPAYKVNSNVAIDDLLDGFKSHKAELAIVYNGKDVVGIITMEDILEELVGSIDESAVINQEAAL